ncbi:glycosyl transferases group 1 [Trichococcus palustris]|uniref:Glycosyl transferases group 1 n=1 Tax=Trichococcus palustris TaxID=140314 RepID=A0A143YGG0_9LACT|nr:glycosyltransferase family 4 protein [Trichococcus palustris]CZQ86353.1 glycosyl transferases group 1 [Trichococcus palustris]SFK58482.1 1,2-diacylglycerol 3-alpha-glucosyltransferase [Trichococcus palustris]
MKILIATDWYSPTVNGVVTSVLNLKKELLQKGHDVRVLTLKQRSSLAYTDDAVYHVPSVSAGKIYPEARFMRTMGGAEVKEILDWHPDIIHTNFEFSTFVLAQRIAKQLHIPIVHTYHTVYEDYTHYFSPNRTFGKVTVRRLSKKILSKTDAVIAPSEKVKSLLESYDVQKPIYTIPTGIDLKIYSEQVGKKRIDELKSRLAITENDFVVLSLGRLAKEKNVDELIHNVAEMDSERIKMVIVGDGPDRERLENLAKECNLANKVIFTGMVEPDKVNEYYQLADVFVSASTSETQGLTYIEAIANGLPAVCKKDACLDGIIFDNQNGIQYEDQIGFAEFLSRLMENPDLKNMMAKSSRRIAASFSAEVFADQVLATYNETLKDYNQEMVLEKKEAVDMTL